MPLTPEQQALRDAAQKYHDRPTDENYRLFKSKAQPDLIIELFADLSQCNEDYGQAVDSVAQLQEEVFEVRARLEAQEAHKCPKQTPYGEATCVACTEAALSQPVQAVPDGSLGRKLRHEYKGGTVVSDFGGPKITLRYRTMRAAVSAFEALTDEINAAGAVPGDPAQ